MDEHPAGRLKVNVNLMSEPCLWCWEIVDARDGTVIESSWATEWVAYKSLYEAWVAGLLRRDALGVQLARAS